MGLIIKLFTQKTHFC